MATIAALVFIFAQTLILIDYDYACALRPSPIETEVTKNCNHSAQISWKKLLGLSWENDEGPACNLTYSGQQGYISLGTPRLDSGIMQLFNLTTSDTYTVTVSCDGFAEQRLLFTASSKCQSGQATQTKHKEDKSNHTLSMSHDDDSQVEVTAIADSTSTVLAEWPVALVFGAAGITITAVLAFYMWKKYQRRQRIMRIFRQGQSDPFQALYSPTSDTYSL